MTDAPFLSAIAGGLLIGASASLLLLFNGRVAGISGIVNGVLFPRRGEALWRVLFLAGLVAGAAGVYALGANAPVVREGLPPALLAGAGLLVGFGAALGSGCTSGHGVCGLGLLSPRSLAATMTFLLVAIGTTFVLRHVLEVL